MIHYLKCSGKSHKTGRLIATAITELQGSKCVYCNKNRPRHPERRHVRWGSTARTSDNGINLRSGVSIASNKLVALVQLRDNGVLVPSLFTSESFHSVSTERRIFRKSHRQNANDLPYFVEPNQLPDLGIAAGFDYALKHIDSDDEYRVHIFGGDLILMLKKIPGDTDSPSRDIRSFSNGWVTQFIRDEPHPGLIALAAKAVSSVGLHFGAVDILHGVDNSLYVLEVNTAPALSRAGAKLYARKFVKWDNTTGESDAI